MNKDYPKSLDIWKKISVVYKGENTKNIKMVTKTLNCSEFCKGIIDDVHYFCSHVSDLLTIPEAKEYQKESTRQPHLHTHGFCLRL